MKGNLMKGKMKGHFRKGKKGTVHELEFIQDPNVFSNFFVFFNCFFVGQVTQWVTWSNIELSAGSARSANKWKSFSKKTLVTMSWLRSPLQTPAPAPPYNRSAPFLTKKHLLPPTVRFMSWLWEFCLQYVSLYWGGKAEAAQVHQSHICLLQQIFSFPLQRAQIPVFYRRYFTLYLKKKICLQIVNSPVCDKLLLPPPWGQLVSTVAQRMKPRESFFLFFLKRST